MTFTSNVSTLGRSGRRHPRAKARTSCVAVRWLRPEYKHCPARWLFRNAFGALSLRRLHACGEPPPGRRREQRRALQSLRRLQPAKKQSSDCPSRSPRMRRLAPLRVGFCWGSGPCWGFRSFVGPRAFTPPLAAARYSCLPRTGKPLARLLTLSGNTLELPKPKPDPPTLDAE